MSSLQPSLSILLPASSRCAAISIDPVHRQVDEATVAIAQQVLNGSSGANPQHLVAHPTQRTTAWAGSARAFPAGSVTWRDLKPGAGWQHGEARLESMHE